MASSSMAFMASFVIRRFPEIQGLSSLISLLPPHWRKISIAAIARDGDDHSSLLALGDLKRSPDIGPGGMPDIEPFLGRETIAHIPALIGANREDLVGEVRIVDLWDDRRGHMFEALETVERLCWLCSNAHDRTGMLFESARRPHGRPARSEPGHEMGNLISDLLKNLTPCTKIMREGIRGVRILIGIKITIGLSFNELSNESNRPIRSFHRIAEDELGAVGARDLFPRLGHIRRHHELDLISERCAEEAVGHARVSARCVDENLVLGEAPILDGILHHLKSRAVFYRAAGVGVLELQIDLLPRDLALETPEADHRRIAYSVDDRIDPAMTHLQNPNLSESGTEGFLKGAALSIPNHFFYGFGREIAATDGGDRLIEHGRPLSGRVHVRSLAFGLRGKAIKDG